MISDLDWFQVVSRWLHIASMATLVGSTLFILVAVRPAAGVLGQDNRNALFDALGARWRMFVHAAVGLLFLTGLYNTYVKFTMGVSWHWHVHALLGLKILLGLFIMFVASVLAGRSRATQPMRDNPEFWLKITLASALVVIALSGMLRFMKEKPPERPSVALGSNLVEVGTTGGDIKLA